MNSQSWKTNPTGIEFLEGTGLYSTAARLLAGHNIPFSGIIPSRPDDQVFTDQVIDVFRLLLERLAQAGVTPFHVWKLTVFLNVPIPVLGNTTEAQALYGSMYDQFNGLYRTWLAENGIKLPPVRVCVAAAWVPKGSLIEIVPEAWVTA